MTDFEKPPGIANDEFKSAKWDELTAGQNFSQSDIPALSLLCQWHKLAQQAQDELDNFGSQTAYQNDVGDLKAFPQIGTLKTCSAEIRQLNKQLGICDSHEQPRQQKGVTALEIIAGRRCAKSNAHRKAGSA